jgi:hypothetical protein
VIKDILSFDQISLSTNLRCNITVRQTGRREQWDLLTTSNGCQRINGRDTRLDHLFGVYSLLLVDWLTLDIEEFLGENWWTLIDWIS